MRKKAGSFILRRRTNTEDADMSPMARSFYAESKKVRNDRIKKALGWMPLYPSYRSGLAAILEGYG